MSSKQLPRAMQYGQPSLLEKIHTVLTLLPLPFVLIQTLLFSKPKHKSVKRTLKDRVTKYTIEHLNIRQLQGVVGTTIDVYERWCRNTDTKPTIEEIDENAQLLWIGERTLDNVVLYFHGGGFSSPPPESAISFLSYIRTTLNERGVNASIAMLQYTLIPEAAFPTQLKQAVTSINHLTQTLNIPTQNIQLIGDSAGGNLILQVLSHILHPLPEPEYIVNSNTNNTITTTEKNSNWTIPPILLPKNARFKGIYLMSPWVDLSNIFSTLQTGNKTDILNSKTIKYYGSQSLSSITGTKYLDYVEPNSASEDWWKGINEVVDRVLITAGRDECLKNEIIRFYSAFNGFHLNTRLLVQPGEVHNDPFLAFAVGEKDGETMKIIVDWLLDGFEE